MPGKVRNICHGGSMNKASTTAPVLALWRVGEDWNKADMGVLMRPACDQIQEIEVGATTPAPVDVHGAL